MPFNSFSSGQRLSAARLNTALDETAWTKRQGADQIRNNNTSLLASTYLTFSLGANTEWNVETCIFYTATTVADIKIEFNLNGSATDFLRMSPWTAATSATTGTNSITHSGSDAFQSLTFTAPGIGTGSLMAICPVGFIAVAANAATFKVQFAQNTAEASDCTLRRGSYVQLSRVG